MNTDRPSDDKVLASLASLPPIPLDEKRREMIRRRAHRSLTWSGVTGFKGRALWFYDRFLEPVSLGGVTVFYLHWAFRAVATIYGL